MNAPDESDVLLQRLEDLEAEVAELRAAQSTSPVAEPVVEIASAVTRRGWMKAAAAAAVGGTAVALSGGERAAAAPTTFELGATNVNAARTQANHTGSSGAQSFTFQSGTLFEGEHSTYPSALGGWTTTASRPSGVFGYTNVDDEDAYGVVGMAQGQSSAGVLARNGHQQGTGLRAIAGGYGVGVDAIGYRAVKADGLGSRGIGVRASGNLFAGYFVSQQVGVFASGQTAAFHVHTYDVSPLQRTNDHRAGELESATSAAGAPIESLWFCVEDGAPGDWRKLAGKDSSGVLHAIAPVRVYDSRRPVPLPGKIGVGQSRVVDVSDGRSGASGAVIAPDAVPEHARAVAYNLTIVDTVARGFLSVAPGDAVSSETSSINWSASNLVLANAGIVKLDAIRSIKVFCGGTGQTNFIVDITGYYL